MGGEGDEGVRGKRESGHRRSKGKRLQPWRQGRKEKEPRSEAPVQSKESEGRVKGSKGEAAL